MPCHHHPEPAPHRPTGRPEEQKSDAASAAAKELEVLCFVLRAAVDEQIARRPQNEDWSGDQSEDD